MATNADDEIISQDPHHYSSNTGSINTDLLVHPAVESHPTPPNQITTVQKLTFISMCLAYLTSMLSFSIIAPFFPLEAEKKHISKTQIGLIFSIYSLVSFIVCPIWGKLIPAIGAKFTFLAGCWISGGCNIIFGVLDELEGDHEFLVFCYIVRSVEAIGSAACITAGMAIVANTFPHNVALVMGWLEVCSGLGYAIGPPLGGVLYKLGGFKLPFMVLGGTVITILIVNLFLLPNKGLNESKEMGSISELLVIPAVWPVGFSIVVGSASLGFLDPTLSIHLEQFNLSPEIVGAVFLLIGGVYAVFSPLWGYIADAKHITRLMITMGFLTAGISYLLIGPSTVLNFPNELWLICIGLGLLGFSIGCGIVPAYLDLLTTAFWYDLPDNLATQSIVAGFFNGLFSLGSFIGPFCGGILVEYIGFSIAASYIACANVMVTLVVGCFGIWEYQCGIGRRKPKYKRITKDMTSRADSETSSLLPEAPSWE